MAVCEAIVEICTSTGQYCDACAPLCIPSIPAPNPREVLHEHLAQGTKMDTPDEKYAKVFLMFTQMMTNKVYQNATKMQRRKNKTVDLPKIDPSSLPLCVGHSS